MRRTAWLLGLLIVCVQAGIPATAQAKAEAHYVPLEIGLFPPINIFHYERKVVTGLSVNFIYGRSASLYGFQTGLINRETENMGGLQLAGWVNIVSETCVGLQVAGFLNYCGRGGGIQVGFIGNAGGASYSGLQLGLLNSAASAPAIIQLGVFLNNTLHNSNSIQVGLLNMNGMNVRYVGSCGPGCDLQQWESFGDAKTRGLSVGLVNYAQHMVGVQVGGANFANGSLAGLQLGVANIASGAVHGVQIGAINYAERLHGLQLGGINIAAHNGLPVMAIVNAGF